MKNERGNRPGGRSYDNLNEMGPSLLRNGDTPENKLYWSIELSAALADMILEEKLKHLERKYTPCFPKQVRGGFFEPIITEQDLRNKLEDFVGYQLKDIIINKPEWSIDISLIIRDWDFRWEVWYRTQKWLKNKFPIGFQFNLFIIKVVPYNQEFQKYKDFWIKYFGDKIPLTRFERFQPYNL